MSLTLAKWRKLVKDTGFTLKVESMSWGLHATYTHTTTKYRMGNVTTRGELKVIADDIAKLSNLINENAKELEAFDIIGLMGSKRKVHT